MRISVRCGRRFASDFATDVTRESNVSGNETRRAPVSLGTRRERRFRRARIRARARARRSNGEFTGSPSGEPRFDSPAFAHEITRLRAESIAPTWQGFILSLSLSLSLSLGWRSSLVSLSVLNGAVPARREEKKARDSEWPLRATGTRVSSGRETTCHLVR